VSKGDAERSRRALDLLGRRASAASLGDALPAGKRASITITITPGGDEPAEMDDEEEDEDEDM
jgi:hypothetical protein